MKIKDGYIVDMIEDQKIAVSLEASADRFSGMIKLDPVAAFLWEQLSVDVDEETLLKAVTAKYDVDAEIAKRDIAAFVDKLEKKGILEK